MELKLYQKIFDHIKSPVIISYSSSISKCNRAFLDLLRADSLEEVQNYSELKKLVKEIFDDGINTQYKRIEDMNGNMQFLEISLSTLNEIDEIYLLEFKSVDDQSLYEEITFVSAHNRELFNNSPDAIVILDSNGIIVDINEAFIWLFGYSRVEAIGKDIDNLVVTDLQKEQAKELFNRVIKQERVEINLKRQTKDGKIIDVHAIAYPVTIDKRTVGNYIIYRDVTHVKKTEKLLHEKEEFLEQLFNRSLFPTAILDEQEIILDTNSKFEELFGYTRDEAVGKHINDLLVSEGFEGEADKFKTVILDNRSMMAKTKRRHKDGYLLDVEAVGSPVVIGGKVQGFFAMYRDIRVEEEALKSLKVLLHTDSLTGLYNRKFIYDAIDKRLDIANKNPNTNTISTSYDKWIFALIYVDLDQFKQVNDTYGHETGDRLLIAIAKKLKQAFSSNILVARIGGDEFLFLVDDISPAEMENMMDTLRNILSKPCDIDGHLLSTVASLGLSHYPEHGKTTDELISSADAYMYKEKKSKRNNMLRSE